MNNPQSLKVPNQEPVKKSYNSIMDAYNSQSKISLIDPTESTSNDGLDGVKAKDIPLSALRPRAQVSTDESGKPVYSKGDIKADCERRADIAKAYRKMQGYSDEEIEAMSESPINNRLNQVQEAEVNYIEDVPDDTEGLLHYLETIIQNTKANLEMMESLYAALS